VNDVVLQRIAEYWPILAFTLHVVVGLCVSSDIVLRKTDTRAALGWMGIVWLTPLVGAFLYFVFGVNRIHRKAQARRSHLPELEVELAGEADGIEAISLKCGPSRQHLIALAKLVGEVTGRELCRGNAIQPLVAGDVAYPAMIEAIDSASHSIAFATYIFKPDRAGRLFVDAFSRAVERGVEVRVLIDAVGARYSWPPITRLLQKYHIRVARFMRTALPWRFQYSNLRNHRKLLVVDGRVGFTGGMNVDAGNLLAEPNRRPINDIHFRIEGPVVSQLQETFIVDWFFAAGETLDCDHWLPKLVPLGPVLARGITVGPDIDFDKLRLVLLAAINSSHESLLIVTPYFLPDEALITALNLAAMRGVTVNIVLPRVNNLRMMKWASTALLPQLLEHGCRIWLSDPPFDHSKLMVVDGIWSLIGSANWDPRSLRLNFEFNIEAFDADLAASLTVIAESKIHNSAPITLDSLQNRPIVCRLRDGFARLASPYL
jgi:cardiolipin synthase A/B